MRPALRRWRWLAPLLLAALVLPSAATAHEEPYSYLDVRITPSGLEGTVIAHVVDLAHEAGIASADSLLEPAVLLRNRDRLVRVMERSLRMSADGAAVRPQWNEARLVLERRSIAFAWSMTLPRAPGELRIGGPLFPYDPPHETYVNVYEGERLALQELLDRERNEAVFHGGGRQGIGAVLRTFVFQGIHHIFIGPDHILFIVGLLLLGGSLRRLLEIVTAFTLAHSVTLALATFRWVDPPPRLIEPLIALSIVYVGIETLLAIDRRRDWRRTIAFVFGFVHGFGFAGVLREFGLPAEALGWSLAAFNVGVELGQAAIVLAVAPTLALLGARHPAAARRLVTVGSFVIIAAGGYWFVQRVFFSA